MKNKIQKAVELGMIIQSCNAGIAWLIENEWWEAYPGQMDEELIEVWTAQLCAWIEVSELEKGEQNA